MTTIAGETVRIEETRRTGLSIDETSALRLLDPTANKLFAATLELSSIATITEEQVARRLDNVVCCVDSAIRQLRGDLCSLVGRWDGPQKVDPSLI